MCSADKHTQCFTTGLSGTALILAMVTECKPALLSQLDSSHDFSVGAFTLHCSALGIVRFEGLPSILEPSEERSRWSQKGKHFECCCRHTAAWGRISEFQKVINQTTTSWENNSQADAITNCSLELCL